MFFCNNVNMASVFYLFIKYEKIMKNHNLRAWWCQIQVQISVQWITSGKIFYHDKPTRYLVLKKHKMWNFSG